MVKSDGLEMNRWLIAGLFTAVLVGGFGIAAGAAYLVSRTGSPRKVESAPVRTPPIDRMADLAGKKGQQVTIIGRKNWGGFGEGSDELLVEMSFSETATATCRFGNIKGAVRPEWLAASERGQKFVIRGKLDGCFNNTAWLSECEFVESPR